MKSLYISTDKCCGCGACEQRCPQNAIQMMYRDDGALYPVISESRCVNCHLCEKVCQYHSVAELQSTPEAYAAVLKDENSLMASSSGGMFFALAVHIISQGGVVYGCAMDIDTSMIAKHIYIERVESIHRLQGSKYVQSEIGHCYAEIEQMLKAGRMVLFTGTPCQVAGLKKYLLGIEYENLFTVDIICHGVPGSQLFNDYLSAKKKKVVAFTFREKMYGWRSFVYKRVIQKKGRKTTTYRPANRSSYYRLFMKGVIYRESCYACPYANQMRVSDLTIGDYWGVEQEMPQILGNQPSQIVTSKGVSSVLINSGKGHELFEQAKLYIKTYKTTVQQIVIHNGQLRQPSQSPKEREQVMKLYQRGGYQEVDSWYKRQLGIRHYYYTMIDIWNYDIRKLK